MSAVGTKVSSNPSSSNGKAAASLPRNYTFAPSDCRQLGIAGVTLHSYRYAWAERAKTVGYPERFAQEALGHNSNAVHRAFCRPAEKNVRV